MSDKTSIQISRALKDRLDKLGNKGDTYEDIIERLVNQDAKNRRSAAARRYSP